MVEQNADSVQLVESHAAPAGPFDGSPWGHLGGLHWGRQEFSLGRVPSRLRTGLRIGSLLLNSAGQALGKGTTGGHGFARCSP